MNYAEISKKLSTVGISDSKFASRIDSINRQIESLVKMRKDFCEEFLEDIYKEIDDSLMQNKEDRENEKKSVEWVIVQIMNNHCGESFNPYL